mgnify:CR=1 FL=1
MAEIAVVQSVGDFLPGSDCSSVIRSFHSQRYFGVTPGKSNILDHNDAIVARVGVGHCDACIQRVRQASARFHVWLKRREQHQAWLKINRYIRQVDVVSFKLMGVLEEYRRRGIDALLYLEAVKAVFDKGYAWLDGSLTSERNPMVNLIAHRLGAERYKYYRLYTMSL